MQPPAFVPDEHREEVLEHARKAMERKLCDHCLGRLFGALGHGYGNDERGSQLREALGEAGQVPPSDCWLCDGLFDELSELASLAVRSLDGIDFESFALGSRIDQEVQAREETLWRDTTNKWAEPIKTEVNREVGKRLETEVPRRVELEKPDVVAILDTRFFSAVVQVSPIFLLGRYRKLERGIPQTWWPCRYCRGMGCRNCDQTGKLYPTSVQEIIGDPVKEAAKAEEHFFHGMGREDIDARMLGDGRPFILELRRPRVRSLDLAKLEAGINREAAGKVQVNGLAFTHRDIIVRVKEAKPDKTYEVRVRCESSINEEKLKEGLASLGGAILHQKTPNRVMSRRADLVRKREVRSIETLSVDKDEVVLQVRAESGTYIKELVHGDEGRTLPNLAQFLGPCTVLSLDVTEIHLEKGMVEWFNVPWD